MQRNVKRWGSAVLVMAAVAVAFIAGTERPAASQFNRAFSCEYTQGVYMTVVNASDGQRPFIRWVSNAFLLADYTPERRCQEVTNRMNRYFADGNMEYITHGTMNDQPVLCITDREGGSCTGLLYTLKPDQDPQSVLEDLLELSNRQFQGTRPLREGPCTTYVDVDSMIAGRPTAREVCSQ